MPAPAIKNPGEHFNTVIYTGSDNDAVSQSGTGVGFKPDLVVIKKRNATASPAWWDQVRGEHKGLNSDGTDAEITDTYGLETFDSDGFTVRESQSAQGQVNTGTLVAWNWKANGSGSSNSDGAQTTTVSANTTAGFSIVTGTGTGSSTTYGHGLGVEPKVIIIKSRSGADDWYFFTSSIDGIPYNTWQYSKVNTTNVFGSTTEIANNTTTFSTSYGNGTTFVAYCFAEVEGFSQFGLYEGNASAAGPFRNCGFRPGWLMFRGTASGNYWLVIDNKRDLGNDDAPQRVYWNVTDAESTYSQTKVDLVSNGFKIRGTYGDTNPSGALIFYMAFAESPFKYANAR